MKGFSAVATAALLAAYAHTLCAGEFCGLDSCVSGTCFDSPRCSDGAKGEEEKKSYGPCPCEPRKTLLQWSYGTTFSGGPPGRDEPLASDRPDFVEASVTVGRGVAQVEMGYTFIYDNDNGQTTRSHSYPEMLWRVGMLAEWLEFRIAYNHGGEAVALGGQPISNNTGAQDLYLGFKIGLTPQEGILPEMALVPQMTVPLGSVFSADIVLPGVNWLYGWDINDFLSLGASTQLNKAVEDNGYEYHELAQAWTIGYALSERVGAYTEWFGIFPSGAQTALPEYYFDGGFIFRVSNDLQLDIRAGVGLNNAADDLFAGSGLVKRF